MLCSLYLEWAGWHIRFLANNKQTVERNNMENMVRVALKTFNVSIGRDKPVTVEYKGLMISALNSIP